jgi:hypothetical protein
MASLAYPDAEKDDPKSVVSALETGRRDWDRGELRDAVRWVHRAADAAEAAGNDGRALALARVAADLVSSLEETHERDEAVALAPFDDFNDQTIVDSPAVMVARQNAQGVVSIADRAGSQPAPAWNANAASVRARATLRVAVGLEPSGDGNLSVVILPDGAEAPSGTTEALLVMLDPDARIPVRFERFAR